MAEGELKVRTKRFALRVLKLVDALPENVSGRALANQLVRSGTSVGANYRAACRGRSKADFLARLAIAEEEADETCYWLELITESQMLPANRISPLLDEADQLTRILVASIKTARAAPNSKIQNPK
jgi:four helix bundle protein